MKDLIKKLLRENLLLEDTTFDKRMYLKKWYEEESSKLKDWIDANYSASNVKLYNYKSDKLRKIYNEKNKELESKKNPYGHEGNINASVIYHYTNGESLINIINSNMMHSGVNGTISFTTGNLYKQGFTFWGAVDDRHDDENTGIKIKFNFNLMKHDGYKFYTGSGEKGTYAGEYELMIRENIEGVNKYINEIYIFKDKEENFKEVIKFLDSKNIKYKIINEDKPIYREKENEIIKQEELIRNKKWMSDELNRVIRVYKVLYKKIDPELSKVIKTVFDIFNSVEDGISKLFSQYQIGFNFNTNTAIKRDPEYYKEIDANKYNEINKYYSLIDKISTSNVEIGKMLNDNINNNLY